MSQKLINLSPDLKRLRDEGYTVAIKGGYLFVSDIPYVNGNKEIKIGTLVSELDLASNTRTAIPSTHVIKFIGDYPCNNDGSMITAIHNSTINQQILPGIIAQHQFSCKPNPPYANYYEKITRYAEIISNPAKSLNRNLTEKPFKIVHDEDEESVFQYSDTNSSRANISVISSKLHGQKIAIVGLGGTGSYILDLVAKTPVKEIHLFDGDEFIQHNTFRSPGAISNDTLEAGDIKKVPYFKEIYSKMHKGIIAHPYKITAENITELQGMSYVFICVDKNSVRKLVMEYLLSISTPFLDTGIGVNVVNEKLTGQLRVTAATPVKNDHISNRVSSEDVEDVNEYSTNIQIAELNALNATLAVIKWKKLSGFYHDLIEEHDSTYVINTSQLLNNDNTA
jgi:hypothetical protein